MYIISKLTFVVFVEGNQGRGTFFRSRHLSTINLHLKNHGIDPPFLGDMLHVITGGENTSSTVKLKLRGKLCNPFKDLDRDFENNPIFLLAKIF